MGFRFEQKGDFSKTLKFLNKSLGRDWISVLGSYGEKGCQALSANTPMETGRLASSWYYTITENKNAGTVSLNFCNSDIENDINIAILIQYDHATGNGGFVVGRDYINPALQPIFDELAEKAWKEVTTS